jgi:choline dehydrogenase
LRSGIGPAQELEEVGVKPIIDLPEVGKNLHDHVLIRVSYGAPQEVTLHGLTRADKAAGAFLKAWLFGTGPMTVFPLEAGAYIRTKGDDIPTIQSHFLPALSTATMRFNPFRKSANNQPGFMANASVMRPVSRGFIRLTGSKPTDPLKICVNYLEDDRDLFQLIAAIEILRDVFAQKQFNAYRKEELSPGHEIRTKNALSSWIRQNASTVHHLCGSCRMGVDKNAVVESVLRVQGVEGLRIADASVFPSIPSANTAAPTMMVAEKAADYILREN